MSDERKHILVVEDESDIAGILCDYLHQSAFRTTCVENGAEVSTAFKRDHADLVLLDLMLPGKDGLDVCRELRGISSVPIIMVTAKADEIDRLIGLEIGADDYICKPFSPREVVARVKVVLRRTHFSPEKKPQKQPIVVDEERYRATANDQLLDLTPTEFRLLKLLAGNPGRVYSRAQILDLCYAQEQLITDRVIDSHIKNLRKKLAKAVPGEVIHAVYGVGYRFEVE